jgi:hypothetical protein
MTEHALADLLAQPLSELDLVALIVDGVHCGSTGSTTWVWWRSVSTSRASTIRSALVDGSTENTTVVRGLLVGLRERGLDTTKPILAVLDGARHWPRRSPKSSTTR